MAGKNNLGVKVQEIRTIQKLTVDELADRSGLQAGQIQKIEKEGIIPSLSPLIKIARALGVRLGTFLDDVDNIGPVVARGGEHHAGVRFTSEENGSREHLNFFSLAADKAGRNMEPFIVEIEPSEQSDYKLSTHEGEEFIYVIEGQIEINYGKDLYQLAAGDSIYLDSFVMHNVHAANNQKARVLVVLYTPF
ncbi:helix-turn-helix domain-containing protein [Mangrovibacterium diazotrophicum]|uniref:XRE family transcriptional regulator n=1 Tax=Mangrovibacterium diazotrophicum TaxID=1261403 RepID=A0A419W8G3_9BACT|nr:XRE family transcriptional regulator [Mangrovibacterium diazotrophicum]RKD91745.1 XRE family transcriptional regulator [Mangrovibacterium diazotrophicum]